MRIYTARKTEERRKRGKCKQKNDNIERQWTTKPYSIFHRSRNRLDGWYVCSHRECERNVTEHVVSITHWDAYNLVFVNNRACVCVCVWGACTVLNIFIIYLHVCVKCCSAVYSARTSHSRMEYYRLMLARMHCTDTYAHTHRAMDIYIYAYGIV